MQALRMQKLERVRDLREEAPDAYLDAVLKLAKGHPSNVEVRLEAAYALDSLGEQADAIVHYDAAYELGVDAGDMDFPLSYGAILRALGRFDLALAILGEATIRFPDYVPLRIVLALCLHSAGHTDAGLATMLEVVLQLGSGDDALDGYEESLAQLQQDLLQDPGDEFND